MRRVRTSTGSIPSARYQLQRAILENVLESNYTSEDHKSAMNFFGGCAFCGKSEVHRKDHLVSVKNCGDFVRNNVVPACQECDDSKQEKDYQKWMCSASSPSSLKSRGLGAKQIEQRIRLIEKWQEGYKPKTTEQLFGKYHGRYKEILKKMDTLCDEAKQLIDDVRAQRKDSDSTCNKLESSNGQDGVTANRIRQLILDEYIKPARSRGDKTVTIRSGDIHARMQLRQRYPNVCQAMKGPKFLTMANVKLLSVKGPKAGGNVYYEYSL